MSGLNSNLSGKVAFVTGGGGVLCGAMAKSLAGAGAKVAIADLRKDAADKVAAAIVAAGGSAMGVECNVLEQASIRAAREVVEQELGPRGCFLQIGKTAGVTIFHDDVACASVHWDIHPYVKEMCVLDLMT